MDPFDTNGVYKCDVCGQMVPADCISTGEILECDDCLDGRIRTEGRAAFAEYRHEHPLTVQAEKLREAADLERARRRDER